MEVALTLLRISRDLQRLRARPQQRPACAILHRIFRQRLPRADGPPSADSSVGPSSLRPAARGFPILCTYCNCIICRDVRTVRYESSAYNYRLDSSAACDASASLADAVFSRSSERSRSSSISWTLRLRAATSDSAWKKRSYYD